jgi:flagellin
MRIQHNVMAMNAYRNYNNNTKSLSANLEKLSSGYKINRAGDDAAGLAISEKMRAQITGLDAAKKNAKDANGLIKTAEGALQEVQDMLNRMVYLAEQSANGTYDNAIDRNALQDEVDSLVAEINRIGETANFNGKKLLNGEMGSDAVTQKGMQFQIGDTAASADRLQMTQALGSYANFDLTRFIASKNTAAKNSGTGAAQAGAVYTIDITSASSALQAVAYLRGASVGVNNPVAATKGLINMVSKFRGKLGAVSNRLDHTVNNLSVMQENIQDAESSIRDTDVADEMMKYTKNNILVQSAQAMLAQANTVPQGVLQLLQ